MGFWSCYPPFSVIFVAGTNYSQGEVRYPLSQNELEADGWKTRRQTTKSIVNS